MANTIEGLTGTGFGFGVQPTQATTPTWTANFTGAGIAVQAEGIGINPTWTATYTNTGTNTIRVDDGARFTPTLTRHVQPIYELGSIQPVSWMMTEDRPMWGNFAEAFAWSGTEDEQLLEQRCAKLLADPEGERCSD